MNTFKISHGLCSDCLSSGNWDTFQRKKPLNCTVCDKQPDLLYNQQPYCSACYLSSFSNLSKSDAPSQTVSRHKKSKSFLRPVDKSQLMKKSFLPFNEKMIHKIQKLFTSQQKQNTLISYLNKKAITQGQITWQKLASKVNKVSSIIYIFVSKQSIIGAYHHEAIAVDGQHHTSDKQSGIFSTDRHNFSKLEFSRVKDDIVAYNSNLKVVKFGHPSSFEVHFDQQIRVQTELADKFQWMYFYIFKP